MPTLLATPGRTVRPKSVRRKPERPFRLFSLAEYHWLIERGFFRPNDRVELIQGQLVAMSPIHPPHASTVTRLSRLFERCVEDPIVVRTQQPITLEGQNSEPEPDIVLAVASPTVDEFDRRHPSPAELLLVCEVPDTTLNYDRKTKRALYANAEIREYWIVNVYARTIEVHRNPVLSGHQMTYRQQIEIPAGQKIAPLALPDCEIDPALFLPLPRSN